MTDNENMEKSAFDIDFDSYIKQSEPSKQEKGKLWQTAIGLQQVDGLTPSQYLYDTAKRNIDGEITIAEAKELIKSYYESKTVRLEDDDEKEEADKVAANITEILSEKTFNFSPSYLKEIHKRLFKDVLRKVPVGSFRKYNITKQEWVLDGDTVFYSDFNLIQDTLDYDFNAERNFDYSKLSKDEFVKHFTRFVANLWQVHAFGEGNTRTTAVFTIKYLGTLGYDVTNEVFEDNSWYFRNSLARANYTNAKKDIYMNTEYLEKFFRNLILGEKNELKNRYCHVRYSEITENTATVNATVNATVKLSKSQKQILEEVAKNSFVTQEELAEIIGIHVVNIKKNMKKLQNTGFLKREGSDKSGKWEVIDGRK